MQNKPTIKILHITPNLGSGVGTVVLNYLSKIAKNKKVEHKVFCLDYANENSLKVSKEKGFLVKGDMHKEKNEVLKAVENSDIVLIHWWNHPLLYELLVKETLPPSRVIFWSHVSGLVAPNNFTQKALKYPDIFAFTTPVSYESKEIKKLGAKYKKNIRTVWSTGGLDRIKNIKKKKHTGFNIGYVGTVDFVKMHPQFLDLAKNIKIPGVKFIVVGGPNNKDLQKEVEKNGLKDKFLITGFVPEKEKWNHLQNFDVFGYALSPNHYGSSDQVLQEAMGIGIPPVVFNNPMERYMVENGKTGLVVKNNTEYVEAIEKISRSVKLKSYLSKKAREYAHKTFSLSKMEHQWNDIFIDILKLPKTQKKWEIKKLKSKISPKDIFLESIGDYAQFFNSVGKIKKLAISPNWRSKSKGTVHQYDSFLSRDPNLSKWSKLM